MFKIIGKIFGILISIILICILVTAVYSLVQTKFLHKDYASFFGYTVFEVATGSMSPNIEIGDVIIDKVGADNINLGDIITYKTDAIITHRVIGINGDWVTTKGDANNSAEGPIKKEEIIGKVVKIVPRVGIWKKVFLTPQVYAPIITTIVLLGLTVTYSKHEKKEHEAKSHGKHTKDE